MPRFLRDDRQVIEINDLDGLDQTVSMEVRLKVEDLDELVARYDDETSKVTLGYLLPDTDAQNPLEFNDAMGKIMFWGGSNDRDQYNHGYANTREIMRHLGLEDNDGYVDREIEYVPDIDKKFKHNDIETTLWDMAWEAWSNTLCVDPVRVRPYLEAHDLQYLIEGRYDNYAAWLSENMDKIKEDAQDVNGVFYEELTQKARELYKLHWRAFLEPGVVIIEPVINRDSIAIRVTDDWNGDYTDGTDLPSLWVADENAMANLTYEGKPYEHAEAVKYAEATCSEYVKWSEGDVWGVIVVEAVVPPFYKGGVIPYDDNLNMHGECWGFVGHDYAKEELMSQCGFGEKTL